ncbi:carbonic anhydrase 7 [Rhipicephalus sanguineus]|uniref:carbonic anhydrase 7 n=1 Tax=Rhipicephalus sanguineus TaxID=34632 RepID=UPI0020C1D7D7|nr:carbonic anhydrase 7 [Rhipicephalus sanguineus]
MVLPPERPLPSSARVFGSEANFEGERCHCEDEWTYGDGVAQWPNLDLDVQNQCGGSYQSPIDLVWSSTTYDEYLGVVNYYGYLDPLRNVSIVNDGHTAKVSSSKATNVRITGAGLNGWYKFEQLHFHWGSNSSLGSEHRIDGYTFPIEMHLVHMNTKYSTGEEALKHRDGLAVVAVFFQVSPRDNPALSAIVGALRQMSSGSTTRVNLTSIPPLRQLMPQDPQLYYRYQGSLTTPPCSEVVTWTVLAQPSGISEAQLQAFRNLVVDHGNGSSPEHLVNNFRPVTTLNGRPVFTNF